MKLFDLIHELTHIYYKNKDMEVHIGLNMVGGDLAPVGELRTSTISQPNKGDVEEKALVIEIGVPYANQ